MENGLQTTKLDISISEDFKEKIGQLGMVEVEEFDYFLLSVPSVPTKEIITKILMEIPSRLLFLKTKVAESKAQLADAKTELSVRKRILEAKRSEIRKTLIDDYNEQLKQYRLKSEEIMRQVMSSSENATLKKTYLQEMLKVYVPNKPSKAELDDEANILTLEIQEEINRIETEINDFSIELEILSVKEDFYNNMWISVRAYKGILVEEMRMRES